MKNVFIPLHATPSPETAALLMEMIGVGGKQVISVHRLFGADHESTISSVSLKKDPRGVKGL